MKSITLTPRDLSAFARALQREERSQNTIEKYLRDATSFYHFLPEGKQIAKEQVQRWKASLIAQGYAVTSINSMLAAVNHLLVFLKAPDCRVKQLKRQRSVFRDTGRELSREEYRRLLETAREQGKEQLYLLLQAICATGIRVSEVPYLTVEAVRLGRAVVTLKGKTRTILLPESLRSKLLGYAGQQGIQSGVLFRGYREQAISRKTIWAGMKQLCAAAGVEESKVFPHNLRHLFARAFYEQDQDIVRLADVLGHSSVETTRIYTMSSGEEHARTLEQLGLVM